MIPTQPGVRNPFENPDNTWRPYPTQSWQCPYCQQWIGNAQYHNCQGTTWPLPVTTNEITFPPSGSMGDFLMYDDFKKLFRTNTVSQFKERFISALSDLEGTTPVELGGQAGFGIDVIEDVFDDVAKGINNNTDL